MSSGSEAHHPGRHSAPGRSVYTNSWTPQATQWAAQQLSSMWSYVERVIGLQCSTSHADSDQQQKERQQDWPERPAARHSWPASLPQTIPGLKTLQATVPKYLESCKSLLSKQDGMELPTTVQHAYELNIAAAQRPWAQGPNSSAPGQLTSNPPWQ